MKTWIIILSLGVFTLSCTHKTPRAKTTSPLIKEELATQKNPKLSLEKKALEKTKSSTASLDLQFLREEEKLARDVYITLYKTWNNQVFDNISKSEQRHMDQVKIILDKEGISDPIQNNEVGIFINPKLKKLYQDLVEQGKKSEIEALKVGATIEDLDIRDIEKMILNTNDQDTLAMYKKLLCGSRNHIRAFTRQLRRDNQIYQSQFISSKHYQDIIIGSHERCNPDCKGHQGRGQGQGFGQRQGRGQGQGFGQRQGRGQGHK